MAMPKYYVYILFSAKSRNFYYGYTDKLKERFVQHNSGLCKATKPEIPWRLVWYAVFEDKRRAKNFELYLKSGSGKAFAYKRLVNVALKKDFAKGRKK